MLHFERSQQLQVLLKQIINDATGDIKDPNKRVWPIRAALYREATCILQEMQELEMEK